MLQEASKLFKHEVLSFCSFLLGRFRFPHDPIPEAQRIRIKSGSDSEENFEISLLYRKGKSKIRLILGLARLGNGVGALGGCSSQL